MKMTGSLSGNRQHSTPQPQPVNFNNLTSLKCIPTSSTACDVGNRDEMRPLDCNLGALCEHIQLEGWSAGAFSDVVVHAMGSTYYLHRLILSRSSYFRHMLEGPWKEAGAPEVILQIDDENVNEEAVGLALAYLYGYHPKLDDNNAFRVLAAASFLDLQDLCVICTDFIISELYTENFLGYQNFAESQDYGIHGERVRKACWGFLCRGAAIELKEILPKLSTQTLLTLLISDELWVPNEERRLDLAISVLMARGVVIDHDHFQVTNAMAPSHVEEEPSPALSKKWEDASGLMIVEERAWTSTMQGSVEQQGGAKHCQAIQAAHATLMQVAESLTDSQNDSSCNSSSLKEKVLPTQQVSGVMYVYRSQEPGSFNKSQIDINMSNLSTPLVEIRKSIEASTGEGCPNHQRLGDGFFDSRLNSYDVARFKDQSESSSSLQLQASSSGRDSSSDMSRNEKYSAPAWGGRVVGRRQIKAYSIKSDWIRSEDWDGFLSLFEGGGFLYCHMTFEGLLNVRGRLEELGFPCKAVCDGLWLQTLLRQTVLSIGADKCMACSLFISSCSCRQAYIYPHGRVPAHYYRDDQERNVGTATGANFQGTDAQAVPNGSPVQGRVHVRGAADGLAAVVGLSQGSSSGVPVHSDQTGKLEDQQHIFRVTGDPGVTINTPSSGSQKADLKEHVSGQEWETNECASISLDLETPLRTFPPFRFGVEFENVHRLADGQSKHSPETFYAGSLWKVSAQAFRDEDPQGRRTLGLFLHRRRAESIDSSRKVYLYTDTREKVTARYQLICPSKREVMIIGSLTQAGNLLPKAPKGWGWRTAFLFDELADLLQGGSLRIAAVVQLV